MQREVKFAGFGGQGILSAGKFLADAALIEGKEVAWVPSYGPEMRGGTAYCTVVVSDTPIGSPIVNNPTDLVAMNRPSLEKFEADPKEGGLILINTSLIPERTERKDVTQVLVDANEVAIKLGNTRGANMVALGAYVEASGTVKLQTIIDYVPDAFASKPQFIDSNIACIEAGAEIARKALEKAK